MAVALHRTGTSGGHFNDPAIKLNDKDLVAYWNFDEGQGYQVKDQTSNGHHLHATNAPQWQVSRTQRVLRVHYAEQSKCTTFICVVWKPY